MTTKRLGRATLLCTVLFTLACLALAWTLGGCAARVKNVTGLPANVTQAQAQNWDSAVANLHKIAIATSTLRQAVIEARGTGAFPDNDAYVITLRGISKIDQAQVSASSVLRQFPQTFNPNVAQQVGEQVQLIASQLAALNSTGVTQIKNPESLKTVNQFLAEISAAVNLLLSLTSAQT